MKTQLGLCVIILLFIACNKPPVEVPDFAVSDSWQCTINGINYTGSIDTSFMEIHSDFGSSRDTLLYCTGTSFDKKSNIFFRLFINRTSTAGDPNYPIIQEFSFDTCSTHRLWARINFGTMKGHIENFNGNKFSGSFSGSPNTEMGSSGQTVSDGKFSFQIGKGTSEPKFLSCDINNKPLRGFISEARVVSNALIMNGFAFHTDSTFQLIVRTGGTLKPGLYKSLDGNAGFQTFIPSIVTNYVSDAIGNMTVTIESVKDNIVEGFFSGAAQGVSTGSEANLTGGKFRCRVKNYLPQADAENKWGFCESNGLQYPFQTWSGNLLNAVKYQQGSAYYVVLNGESDHGTSVFKIKLRSNAPIAPGIYENNSGGANNVDSLYFYCAPMNFTYVQPLAGIACQIDSLDNQKIVGRFYGNIGFYFNPYGGISFQRSVRRGFFKGNF